MTSPTHADLLQRADVFVSDIRQRIARPGGDRSALRRVLGHHPERPVAHQAHRIISPYTSDGDGGIERAFYTIAALLASQPRRARDSEGDEQDADDGETQDAASTAVLERGQSAAEAEPERPVRRSLGQTLAEAVVSGEPKLDTAEARLLLLCRQSAPGLHRHLPRLIIHLRTNLVPVDWSTLLADVALWERQRDRITKRWLQDFYRTHHRLMAPKTAKAARNDDTKDDDA